MSIIIIIISNIALPSHVHLAIVVLFPIKLFIYYETNILGFRGKNNTVKQELVTKILRIYNCKGKHTTVFRPWMCSLK